MTPNEKTSPPASKKIRTESEYALVILEIPLLVLLITWFGEVTLQLSCFPFWFRLSFRCYFSCSLQHSNVFYSPIKTFDSRFYEIDELKKSYDIFFQPMKIFIDIKRVLTKSGVITPRSPLAPLKVIVTSHIIITTNFLSNSFIF